MGCLVGEPAPNHIVASPRLLTEVPALYAFCNSFYTIYYFQTIYLPWWACLRQISITLLGPVSGINEKMCSYVNGFLSI